MKRLEYSFHIALPFILMAAGGALNAVLPAISNYHPSGSAGILTVALAGVIGDWLRAQIARWKQDAVPAAEPTFVAGSVEHFSPVALPALPVVDSGLLVALVERALRDHLAAETVAVAPAPEPQPAVAIPALDAMADRPAVVPRPRAVRSKT